MLNPTPYILVLEDEPSEFALVTRALTRGQIDCETRRVCTEEEFVREIAGSVPKAILSDHGLPGFSGMEALQLARERCPQIPFIFVSGSENPAEQEQARRAGATDWVNKSRLTSLPEALRAAWSMNASGEGAKPIQSITVEQQLDLLDKEVTGASLFLTDNEGHIASWNRAAEEMFGYRPDEVHGTHVRQLYRAEDLNVGKLRRALREAAETGRSSAEEWRRRRDGAHIWVRVTVVSLRDSQGCLTGFAHVCRNVTEHQQVVETLHRTEEQFQQLGELCPDPVFVITRGKIVWSNRAAKKLLGQNPTGAPAERYLPAIGRETFLNRLCKMRGPVTPRTSGAGAMPAWFAGEQAVTADGAHIAVEAAACEVELKDEPGVLLMLRDLTPERRAHEAVRAAEAAGAELRAHAPIPIIEVDAQTCVAAWNPAAERLFGCAQAEAVGRRLDALIGCETITSETLASLAAATAPKRPLARIAQRAERPDLSLELFIIPTADRSAFTIFVHNTTELARSQHRLRQAEERLRLFVDAVEETYAVYILDAEGKIVVWNEAAQRLHGYTADEICGSHFGSLYPIEDGVSGKPTSHLRLAELEGEFREESWRMHRNGSRCRMDVLVTALRREKQDLQGFLVIARAVDSATKDTIPATSREEHAEPKREPDGATTPASPAPAAASVSMPPATEAKMHERLDPLFRAQQATQATAEARRALEQLASQTRTPWGTPALLSTTQVLELEKAVLMLELRLERQEIAVRDAEHRLTVKNQELARVEALLKAREEVLLAAQKKLDDDSCYTAALTPAEAAALRGLQKELQRQEEALKRHAAELKEREAFVEECEARLLDKIQAQQEREMELEQRAENIEAKQSGRSGSRATGPGTAHSN